MTSILRNQEKYIKLYNKLLDVKKKILLLIF